MNTGGLSFYVTGGTLRYDSPSYVERIADRQLLEGLLHGEFCYVLTSRQMGKSSLMVRTARKLRERGSNVIALDLTAIGQNLTPEQWYNGLLTRMGQQLGLEDQLEDFWWKNSQLGPLQRFFSAIRKVVLAQRSGPLVIFVDELDVVRSLPFSTDEFFAAIRECYTRRTEDEEFGRLTFCLLGVANATDLIKDTRITPFNIGRRIELDDFSVGEAASLAGGLVGFEGTKEDAQQLLQRIHYWTHGHPYLTQRLCQAVASAKPGTAVRSSGLDALCDELFFNSRARDRDENLIFVRERILRSAANSEALLDLYLSIWRGNRVIDDETDWLISVLRLSGIFRVANGTLKVRNRIYERVFDRAWVQNHMPEAELRRQRAAYRRGTIRTAALALGIIVPVLALTAYAFKQSKLARISAGKLEIEQANSLLESFRAHESLAHFARIMRHNPRDRLAASRVLFILSQRNFALPATKPLVHSNWVWSARFSRNGDKVVTASVDGTAQVWNAKTGDPIRSPIVHSNNVTRADFSPNGDLVATASEDTTARISLASSNESVPLEHGGKVWWAQFNEAGTQLATGSADGYARIWEVHSNTAHLKLSMEHESDVWSAVFNPEGSLLLTACQDKAARLWSTRDGTRIGNPLDHQRRIYSAQFSATGQMIATASDDGIVKIWDTATTALIASFTNGAPVFWSEFSRDGRFCASASADRTARLFDIVKSTMAHEPFQHGDMVRTVRFNNEGTLLATASDDFYVRIWDVRSGARAFEPIEHFGEVWLAEFNSDGTKLATASLDGTAKIWDIARRAPRPVLVPSNVLMPPPHFLDDGRHLVTFGSNALSRCVALEGSNGSTKNDNYLAVNRTGSHSLSLSNSQYCVWVSTNRSNPVFRFKHEGAGKFEFSPSGRFLVSRSERGVQIRDIVRGVLLSEYGDPKALIDFTPADKEVYVAVTEGERTSFRVLSQDGKESEILFPHNSRVTAFKISPDNSVLCTAARDSILRVWDLKTKQKRHRAGYIPSERSSFIRRLNEIGTINSLDFNRSGEWLLTGSDDGTARIWDVNSGHPLSEPFRHPDKVDHAEFSPDQRRILAFAGGTAYIWEIPPSAFPAPAWLADFAEAIAGFKIDEFGNREFLDEQHLFSLRDRILAQPAEDPYASWVRRMFPFTN